MSNFWLDLIINAFMVCINLLISGFLIGISLKAIMQLYKEKKYILCGMHVALIVSGIVMTVLALTRF